MPIELTVITIVLLFMGLATLFQQFSYLNKKRVWRACNVTSVSVTKWQNLMPFYQFTDKQLLVEYCCDGISHSCIIPFSKRFYRKSQQGKSQFVFVDPKQPDVVAKKMGYVQLGLAISTVVISALVLVLFSH